MRKEIYRKFSKTNPVYIVGRGFVFIDRELFNMNDTIIDVDTDKRYLIVGIERSRVLTDPTLVVPPYGYLLRKY